MGEWWVIAGLMLSAAGLFWTIHTWRIKRHDKARQDLNSAQDRQLDEHNNRLNRHEALIGETGARLSSLRDEVHTNYVRVTHLDALERRLLDHNKEMERKLTEHNTQVHQRLSGLARDLNETMGKMKANHENEVTGILEKIQTVLERKGD